MAQTSLRQKSELALGGLMAISLPAAMIGGTVAIIRFAEPDGATAIFVADVFAWIFTASFLATFALAMGDWLRAPRPLET
jgi:hypothetical protein